MLPSPSVHLLCSSIVPLLSRGLRLRATDSGVFLLSAYLIRSPNFGPSASVLSFCFLIITCMQGTFQLLHQISRCMRDLSLRSSVLHSLVSFLSFTLLVVPLSLSSSCCCLPVSLCAESLSLYPPVWSSHISPLIVSYPYCTRAFHLWNSRGFAITGWHQLQDHRLW